MKKIVTLFIVLALLLVVAPWGIGRVAEQRINAGLDKLVEEAPYLTIVERKWTSGWFRSEQEVTFELFGELTRAVSEAAAEAQKTSSVEEQGGDEAEATRVAAEDAETPVEEAPAEAAPEPATPLRFTVRNEILHGPVLWPASAGLARVNTKLVLSEETRKEIVEAFGTDEPFRLSTQVGFAGGATTRLSGEGRTIKVKEGGQVSYDALNLEATYGRNFDKVSMHGGWPRVEATNPDGGGMSMRGMSLNGESQRVRGELYDTDMKFVIDELSIVDKNKVNTGVANIHYVITSSLVDDFMDVDAKLGSGKVTSPQFQAMQLELNEVHYDFSLRHLHADSLDKLTTALKASYKTPVSDVASFDSVWLVPFKEHGLELLKHDPEFVIDRIGIVTSDGDGVLKGVIKLPGVTAEELSVGWMGLIGKIDADITIEVAQKLIDKIPKGGPSAAAALEQGFAKREGDKLVCRIEFKKGELKVSGQPLPLPGLGGPPAQDGPPVETPPEE